MANRPFNVRTTNNTKYKIASVTKLFTAVLILQLYEQGKLSLHQPVGNYLPGFVGEAGAKVTIHHLLNHTSGMQNLDTVSSIESALNEGLPLYQHPYTSNQLLNIYCSKPLITEPGSVFNYNNADYIMLGKVIENICGKPFQQVLKEQILVPLHMYGSGLLYQYQIINGLADTYFFTDTAKQNLVNDIPVYIQNWYAAGAMYSTTNDLLKFVQALFSYKLIKKEAVHLLISPGLDSYGYGVWLGTWKFNNKDYHTVQRPGSIMGAQVKLVHIVNDNSTIIILGNTSHADVNQLAYEIGKLILSYN